MSNILQLGVGFEKNTAIISDGNRYTYQDLLTQSRKIALGLLLETDDLQEDRVAVMIAPGFDYVSAQWGIWQAGGIIVPLYPGAPWASIQYVLEDSQAQTIIVSPQFKEVVREYADENGIRLLTTEDFDSVVDDRALPAIEKHRDGMILYTSGTTGAPKGVVSTHANIDAQVSSVVKAWAWSAEDHIISILPLHHVHGIINVVSSALWSGATCEFMPKFNAQAVFDVFKKGEVNLFMAVPTIYYKLITYWESLSAEKQKAISESMAHMRLMVSGSAALPVSVMEKWKKLSGHDLLERYGMTELGMAISNPYHGERKAGYIGQPLPGVQVRLVDENNEEVKPGEQGEIVVKGDNVFRMYWNNPEATEASFIDDRWFKTGDIAIHESGSFKIVGRSSVDIIKSGGYKLSALEIEEALRVCPGVKDSGVVGIPNEEWGEVVCAALVPEDFSETPNVEQIKGRVKKILSPYKIPRKYLFLQDLPRNTMGKVAKNKLKALF